MKKILFVVLPLTILTVVVVQTMILKRAHNLAPLLLGNVSSDNSMAGEASDEIVDTVVEVKPVDKKVDTVVPVSPKPLTLTGEPSPKSAKKPTNGKKTKNDSTESQKSAPAPNPATTQIPDSSTGQKTIETPATTQQTGISGVEKVEKMAVTLFGTPSVYTQPIPGFSSAGQFTTPEQTLSAMVKAMQRPAYILDVSQLDSPEVEKLAQRYDLPPASKTIASLSMGGRDTDGDGLSDLEELRLGTNPRNPDTDGDGFSDAYEVYVLHSNPLDPNDPPRKIENGIVKLDMRRIGIRITSFLENQLVADDRPLIVGLAPAGQLIEVIATNNENKQDPEIVLGQATSNESSVFIVESSIPLPDGDYTFKARPVRFAKKTFNASDIAAQVFNQSGAQDQGMDNSLPMRAKIRSKLDVSPPTPKKLADKSLEGEVLIKNARIEIRDKKPVLVGKTVYGSQVLTTWHSLVMTSALIADTSAGDFEIRPQQEMEFGEHDVYIQAVRPTDGALSKAVKVSFKIEQPAAQIVTPSLKPAAEQAFGGVQKPPEVKSGIQAFMEKQNTLLWSITGVVLLVIIIAGVMIFVSNKKKKPPII